jgi:broad specificity phosphatase PhoE
MKTLYFIRHAESEFNRTGTWTGGQDIPLSKEGRQQAQEAGQKLKGTHFDLILSSPLERAKHTAEYIADAIGYPKEKIALSNRLVERSFGSLEGKRDKISETAYADDESAIDDIPEVEKLQSLQDRANSFLNELYKLPYDSILVVGHGAYGRALYRAVNNIPTHERGYTFGNAEFVKLI